MKIGVLLKQVPDTETKIRVAGNGIDEGDVKWIINPYDEYAVEQALRLQDAEGGEVVIITLGPARSVDAARTALAMGADRAVVLDDPGFAGSDAYGVGKALAAVVEKEGIEIVFTGRQAIDGDNNQVPQIVAAALGWPHVTWINGFEKGDGHATVRRPVGGGAVEVVKVSLPAVFTCSKGLNEPRYASLPGIMKAKRKPVSGYSPADLGVEDVVGADNALVSYSDYHLPPGRPAGRILQGELTDQVRELVRLLREEAKVL